MAVLIFGYFFLASSLCIDFAFPASVPCTLKVFENQSSDHIEDFCTEEFKTSECRPFLLDFDRSVLPDVFSITANDYSVERPHGLSLTPKTTPYKNAGVEYLIPSMFVNWSSPLSEVSRINIKGYLLIWNDGTKDMCRLLKLNTTRTNLLRKKLHFQYDIPLLEGKKNYEVKVYSLPPPKHLGASEQKGSFVLEKMVSGSTVRSFQNPGDWVPSLVVHVKDGAMEVKIGHSPAQFNLTQFEVMLVKRSHDQGNPFKTLDYNKPPDSQSSFGNVSFTDLEADDYKIVVHVVDTFHKQSGKCLCWKMETNGPHCKNSCGSIGTDWMKVLSTVAGNRTANGTGNSSMFATGSTNSPEKSEDNWAKRSLIIGLSVAAAVVVLAVVAIFGFRYFKPKDVDSFSSSDLKSPKDPKSKRTFGLKLKDTNEKAAPLKHRTILIVSTEDNPAHTKFVKQLATFLKQGIHMDAEVHRVP